MDQPKDQAAPPPAQAPAGRFRLKEVFGCCCLAPTVCLGLLLVISALAAVIFQAQLSSATRTIADLLLSRALELGGAFLKGLLSFPPT